MEVVKSKLAELRAQLDEIPALQAVETTVKIPKEYLAIAGGVLTLVSLFTGVGASTICNVVGFLYPAFKSFEKIERRVQKDRQWLAYWIVFAFFFVIECFLDILLYLFPFYYAAKLGFLLWAMLPQTKGAKYLYETLTTERFIEVMLFSISRVNQLLPEASAAEVESGGGAPVYLAAVLQFLTQRILKAAAESAGEEREISTQNLSNGIEGDEDISKVLSCRVGERGTVGDFSADVLKVLQAVNPDKSLAPDVIEVMNTHLNAVLTRVANEAGKLAAYNVGRTVSWREIQTAIRLLFPQDLAVDAVESGTQVMATYTESRGGNEVS